MWPAHPFSEQMTGEEARQLALVMFNTFRMDLEKQQLNLLDLSEQLFKLAFEIQAASTEEAAERLQRMIMLAKSVTERFEQAA